MVFLTIIFVEACADYTVAKPLAEQVLVVASLFVMWSLNLIQQIVATSNKITCFENAADKVQVDVCFVGHSTSVSVTES